jgi:hypothetical protein
MKNPLLFVLLLSFVCSAQISISIDSLKKTVDSLKNFTRITDTRLSDARTPLAHNQAWSTITTGVPTTLSGYGIAANDAALVADTVGLGTALAGKSATAHTHTTIDTCNMRAGKVLKLDSANVLAGFRAKKLVIGSGTLMLDSIEIKDGTTDTLIIGAFGKKWKFLPIANQ